MSPISRREFVGAGIGAAAGLVIGFYLPHKGESQKESFSPNAYLRITPDNKITIVVARSEMGQGVRTALPMILAEELEADWKQIEIEQAGASTLYGDQTTGGSASIRTTWDPMRKAGASAREMLISAAALTWGVSRSTCTAEAGHIKHAASNRSLSYGELVGKASTLPIPSDVTLKQSKDYKIVGQRLPRRRFARQSQRRGHLWHRLPPAGDEVCRARPLSADCRKSHLHRRQGIEKDFGRHLRRKDRRFRRRRRRRQRLVRDGRPPRPQCQLGRRSEQRPELSRNPGLAESRQPARKAQPSMPPENPAKLPAATSLPNTCCLSWPTLPWSPATAQRIFRARNANSGRQRKFPRTAAIQSRRRLDSIPIRSK